MLEAPSLSARMTTLSQTANRLDALDSCFRVAPVITRQLRRCLQELAQLHEVSLCELRDAWWWYHEAKRSTLVLLKS